MSTTTFELSAELEKYGQQLREWSTRELRPRARAADTTKQTPEDWQAILDTCPVPLGRPDKEDDARPTFEEGYWVAQLVYYENLSYGDLWAVPLMSNGLGPVVVDGMGTTAQREKWYGSAARCESVGAFAITEPRMPSTRTRPLVG